MFILSIFSIWALCSAIVAKISKKNAIISFLGGAVLSVPIFFAIDKLPYSFGMLVMSGLGGIAGFIFYLSNMYYCFNNKLNIVLGLFGVFIPFLGILTGAWCLVSNPAEENNKKEQIENMTDQQMVDLIDRWGASCLLAVNHAWMKNTWHAMNDQEKTEWVSKRKILLLKSLPQTTSAADTIIALQQADKDFTRNAA